MGRRPLDDEPASLDSQTHCSLGRGLIDAEPLLDIIQPDPRHRPTDRCRATSATRRRAKRSVAVLLAAPFPAQNSATRRAKTIDP
jgi:hypothetical protein